MALTPENAGHFQHPLIWTSDANPLLALQATWDTSTNSFGAVTCAAYGSVHESVATWVSAASVHPGVDQGVGGLFKAKPGANSANPIQWWGVVASSQSAGATLQISSLGTTSLGDELGSIPPLPALGAFEFEHIGNSAYVIRLAGTTLCLTAGASASSSATAGSVYLTQFSHAANQYWDAIAPAALFGWYDMRPLLAPNSLSITTPSESDASGVQFSLESPRDESASQIWRSTEHAYTSTAAVQTRRFGVRQARGRFFMQIGTGILLPSDVTNSVAPIQQTTTTIANTGARSHIDFEDVSLGTWQRSGISYTAYGLAWINSMTGSTPLDTKGVQQQPLEGGVWRGPRNAESDTTSAWVSVPRDTYDASMPAPSELELHFETFHGSYPITISSLGEVPANQWLRITPRFRLPFAWQDMQATIETRYLLPSGGWSPWSAPATPTLTPDVALTESQLANPDWHIAWAPDAWATEASDGMYESTEFDQLLFSQSLDPSGQVQMSLCKECQVRVKLRSFRYDLGGVPVVGPTATCVVNLSQLNILELETGDNPHVGRNGLAIPYHVWNLAGPMAIHFDTITIGSTLAVSDFDTSITSEQGTILVPWTAFRTLEAAWTRASGTAISMIGATTTIFARSAFALTSSLVADAEATVIANSLVINRDLYSALSALDGTAQISQCLCVIETEADQCVIEMPHRGYSGYATPPALDVAGILDGESQQTARAITLADTAGGYEIAEYDVPRPARGITTLLYQGDNELVIIPVEGNVSTSYSISRDYAAARTLGSNAYIVGGNEGYAPEIELSGVLYRAQLASRNTTGESGVRIASTVQEVCRVPLDKSCILRTAYGAVHLVRIVGVQAPRSDRDQVELSIRMVEVVE